MHSGLNSLFRVFFRLVLKLLCPSSKQIVHKAKLLYLNLTRPMKHLTTLLLLAGITFTVQAQTDCGLPHDINNNGSVDIEDFLSILGLFGDQDSDGDGVYDSLDLCFDLESCNYMDPEALLCTYPDAIGECGGFCTSDLDGDGVCDGDCGGYVNYQGYDYATVLIGEQCWFAENLRSELYSNGDSIPSNLNDENWAATESGAVAIYGEGSSTCDTYSFDGDDCDESWSLERYGRLYNWHAVNDARHLCPSGWHVPLNEDRIELINHLGGSSSAGGAMKTTYGWWYYNNGDEGNGTNSSGFSGLPGGYRSVSGPFTSAGLLGEWWTSSQTIYDGQVRGIYFSMGFNGGSSIQNASGIPSAGRSVRCIQD